MSEDTKKLALELHDAVEIYYKKTRDSREGSRTEYAYWTVWHDVVFKINDEFLQKHPDIAKNYKPINWETRYYNGDDSGASCSEGYECSIDTNVEGYEKVPLEDTHKKIIAEIHDKYLQQCTEEDMYCFLYGENEGAKRYKEHVWLMEHRIINENVTKNVVEKIGGHFEFNGRTVEYIYNSGWNDYYVPIRDEQGKELLLRVCKIPNPNGHDSANIYVEEDNRTKIKKMCDEEGFSDYYENDVSGDDRSPSEMLFDLRCNQVFGKNLSLGEVYNEKEKREFLQDILTLLDEVDASDDFYFKLYSNKEITEKYHDLTSEIMKHYEGDTLQLKMYMLREKLGNNVGKTDKYSDDEEKTHIDTTKNIMMLKSRKRGDMGE